MMVVLEIRAKERDGDIHPSRRTVVVEEGGWCE